MSTVTLRPATAADARAVAQIWYDGWGPAHLGHVPEALVLARTRASFDVRAAKRVADTTVAVVDGAVAGFAMLAEHGVTVHDVRDRDAIVDRMRGLPLWIHVDLDVIEPGAIPTEYRVPGGPSLDETRALLAAVAATADIAALELAEYELEPDAAELHGARIEHLIEPVLARGAKLVSTTMRVWFTVCVMFAVACGKGDAPAKPPCCKVCKVGRPCGDTCIPASQSCTTAPGCACSAAQPCCKICGAQSKPCGDTCIALDQQCHTAEGCACDRAAD